MIPAMCGRYGVLKLFLTKHLVSSLKNRMAFSTLNSAVEPSFETTQLPEGMPHIPGHIRRVVQAGQGGSGKVSYFKDKNQGYGKPDGGDGGCGGHVIFIVDSSCTNFLKVGHNLTAPNGRNGQAKHCHGKSADHLYLPVPPNTVIRSGLGSVLGYIQNHGSYFIAARGGQGGKGNHFFASMPNRVNIQHEVGASGQNNTVYLSHAMKAAVGLMSSDDTGTTKLLSLLTGRQSYNQQFRRDSQYLGMISYDDYEQISVTNISAFSHVWRSDISSSGEENLGTTGDLVDHFCVSHQLLQCSHYITIVNTDTIEHDIVSLVKKFAEILERVTLGSSQKLRAVFVTGSDSGDILAAVQSLQSSVRSQNLDIRVFHSRERAVVEKMKKYLRSVYDQSCNDDVMVTFEDICNIARKNKPVMMPLEDTGK